MSLEKRGPSVPTELLRRLQKEAHSHNWLAVTVDLVIVIVGVFLGIEAANWNESRKERAEERRYYAQVIGDLRTDQRTLRSALERSKRFDEAAEETLQSLTSGVPARTSPGRFAVQLHYAGFLYLPRSARSTYDELISTGNLGLLKNQRAKAAIAEYYATFDEIRQWDGLLRQQQGLYWEMSAGILPRSVLQAAIREREPVLTSAQANHILEEARSRPGMRNLLVSMAAHQERVRRDCEQISERGRNLIQELRPLASG
jgi:hypothetical protein